MSNMTPTASVQNENGWKENNEVNGNEKIGEELQLSRGKIEYVVREKDVKSTLDSTTNRLDFVHRKDDKDGDDSVNVKVDCNR